MCVCVCVFEENRRAVFFFFASSLWMENGVLGTKRELLYVVLSFSFCTKKGGWRRRREPMNTYFNRSSHVMIAFLRFVNLHYHTSVQRINSQCC